MGVDDASVEADSAPHLISTTTATPGTRHAFGHHDFMPTADFEGSRTKANGGPTTIYSQVGFESLFVPG
jgi:hypothetical protein